MQSLRNPWRGRKVMRQHHHRMPGRRQTSGQAHPNGQTPQPSTPTHKRTWRQMLPDAACLPACPQHNASMPCTPPSLRAGCRPAMHCAWLAGRHCQASWPHARMPARPPTHPTPPPTSTPLPWHQWQWLSGSPRGRASTLAAAPKQAQPPPNRGEWWCAADGSHQRHAMMHAGTAQRGCTVPRCAAPPPGSPALPACRQAPPVP